MHGRRPFASLARVRRVAGHLLATRRAMRDLRRQAAGIATSADALRVAYAFRSGDITIVPEQKSTELAELLEVLAEDPPRTVVEIGTNRGGSLFVFAHAAAPDAVIVSVDLPGGPFGGGYSPTRAPLYRSFARGRQRVELIRGNSRDPCVVARTKKALGGRPVDFLFIDGDHSHAGVRADWELYGPLVRSGGLVCFADIGPDAADMGVKPLWEELRQRYDTREILHPRAHGPIGFGLLRIP